MATSSDNFTNHERYSVTRKVTLIGAAVNVLLATAQLIGGFLAQSQALIADGVHTLSDLCSDVVVLVASKEAHKKADDQHPYGHGRIETLATSVLGAILIAVGAGIGIDAIQRLLSPDRLLNPQPLALFLASLAVVSKEGLYQYTVRVAKRINSSLLRANAWHHRSDAISSLVVIAGVAMSLMGYTWFDALAALMVAAMIGFMGWQLLWQSSQELIDTALDEEIQTQIRDAIMNVHGVVSLHQLRTRQSGSDAFADVHIQVPSRISVSEGHQIAEMVRRAVIKSVDCMTDVVVHIDPEDDAHAAPCKHLPMRDELMQDLSSRWAGIELSQHICDISLHYLDGKFEICLYLESNLTDQLLAQSPALKSQVMSHPQIRYAELYTPT